MRLRTTILLLLVLIGLGAYVYLVELPKAENEDKKETLFTVKADEVTEVDLDYGDRKVHLKKVDGKWQMTAPVAAEADSGAVESLVTSATSAEVKKKLEGAADNLAQFGLDKPLVTFTLYTGDKQLDPVSVGKETPIGGSVYARRKDQPEILLASSSLKSAVDKQVKDLREKKIVTFTDEEVKWIEATGDRTDLRAVKGEGETWSIERPGPFAADASAVRTYVSSIRALRAVDFVSDAPTDLVPYGLDKPRLKITVGLKDDSRRVVLLGAKKDGGTDVYAQLEGAPTVYTIGDSSYRNLDKSVRDLRDKMILAFDPANATAIHVERKGSEPYRLIKGADGKWTLEGNAAPLNSAAIDQFVGDLHELKGYEIVGDNPANLGELALDQPRLKVTVSGKDAPLGTIVIGETDAKDGTKNFNSMREGNPTVYLLRAYIFTRIDKSKEDFVQKPTPVPTAGATPPAK